MGSIKNNSHIMIKESVVLIDDKEFKVISYFEGKETSSKLLYDMAVSRILNGPVPVMANIGGRRV